MTSLEDIYSYARTSNPDQEPEDDVENSSEYSMDMINDPRFIQPTVLDKRLFAFTAQVGFVGGLTTGASLGQCFELKKHLSFGYCHPVPWFKIGQSLLQLLSFFGMSVCLCWSLYSTLVSVNQAYFGNRLMTAGTNGFELAKKFYMMPNLARMRHRAISFLGRALILLLLASGGMFYTKFAEDQDVEAGYEIDDKQAKVNEAKVSETHESVSAGDAGLLCESHMHPAGIAVIIMFSYMSFYLYWYIQIPHERSFKEIYAMRYQSGDAFGRLLEADRNHLPTELTGTWNNRGNVNRAATVREASRHDERSLVRHVENEGRCRCM